MNIAFVRLDIHIKFRFATITIGEWSDHIVFPLPSLVQIVEQFVHAEYFGTYNNHGVTIKASLVNSPIG